MILLDGKIVSKLVKEQLTKETTQIIQTGKRAPHLVAILVGSDPASKAYVASKVKTCATIGYTSTLLEYDAATAEDTILAKIQLLNQDQGVDGILVQLPLPKQIKESKVIESIDPAKDVDGFHPINLGRMMLGLPGFVPATPYGILLMLQHYQIQTSGMHCVVIGRSNIVGTPMSLLLSRNAEPGNCTVTICHSRTKNLEELCAQADIIVAALGRPLFLKANMVKKDAIVIDVGINRVDAPESSSGYKLVGDVDFEHVASKVAYLSPVPGGVGLMTICALMKNTMTAYKNKQ